jgi:hypothetical protein
LINFSKTFPIQIYTAFSPAQEEISQCAYLDTPWLSGNSGKHRHETANSAGGETPGGSHRPRKILIDGEAAQE